jgi:hypothetical protein
MRWSLRRGVHCTALSALLALAMREEAADQAAASESCRKISARRA